MKEVCLIASAREYENDKEIVKSILMENDFNVFGELFNRSLKQHYRVGVDYLIVLTGIAIPNTLRETIAQAEFYEIPIIGLIKNYDPEYNLPFINKNAIFLFSYESSEELAKLMATAMSLMNNFVRKNNKKRIDNIENKSIKQLEKELEDLKIEKQILESQGEEKEADHITQKANLEAQVKKAEFELEKANEEKKRGEQIETKLSEAFKGLTGLDKDMRADINRLNVLFVFYFILTLGFFAMLYFIWDDAFTNFKGEDFELAKVWIYSAPSFVLVGFIGAFMHQISRAQRQLLYLKKYNRKYKVIKVALEGYYSVENELNKTPQKAQEIFDLIIKVKLGQTIDFDDEEKKAKASEAQDQSIKEDFAKQIIDAIKSIGSKKE